MADVDEIVRRAARIGLGEQIQYLTDAIARLEEGIEDGDAAAVGVGAREVVDYSHHLSEMVLALAAKKFLGPFSSEQPELAGRGTLNRRQENNHAG
jgi:hypothetical protein